LRPRSVPILRHERIDLENALLGIGVEDRRRVVAREAETGLRQVVGAEREEFRARLARGDLVGA
jgi:hypothetical protein